jgi:hypothetical protein
MNLQNTVVEPCQIIDREISAVEQWRQFQFKYFVTEIICFPHIFNIIFKDFYVGLLGYRLDGLDSIPDVDKRHFS